MAFDLSDLLRDVSVSGLDTGLDAIELIQLDKIDPSPDNFYSLEGINELAGSIEMLGLQQPLLVRPAPGGRFTVISGHRRRAAIMLIRDGGSDQFANGVPCIVDRSEASAALQELKLIMANSDTRKMSSADLNKQAERIEDLLRQLEDEGFEFPGRLRDWVSKLSGMSRTKLARLKVIRDGLDPEIAKKYYRNGKLKEEAAYELARLPGHIQRAVVAWYATVEKRPEYWWSHTIKSYAEDLKRFEKYRCPEMFDGGPCCNQDGLMARTWEHGYHGYCHCGEGTGCCFDCTSLATCGHVCIHMANEALRQKKELKARKKEEKAVEEQAQQPTVKKIRDIWLRFGNALSLAGMKDEDLRKLTGFRIYQVDAAAIASLEAGEYAPRINAGFVLPFCNSSYYHDIERYIKTADALGCSLDYLLCRTDVPEVGGPPQAPAPVSGPDTTPEWRTGTPDTDGRYLCLVDMNTSTLHEQRCDLKDGKWHAYGSPIKDLFAVRAWWPLPEEDPHGQSIGWTGWAEEDE